MLRRFHKLSHDSRVSCHSVWFHPRALIQSGLGGVPIETNPYRFANRDSRKFALTEIPRISFNPKSKEDARYDPDGISVHCNTIEAIWSGLHNFLDRFRGMSQRFLHLRVARYEFLHNHSHLSWQQTFDAAVRSIFSISRDYWRQMVHQHRRIPLTICYR